MADNSGALTPHPIQLTYVGVRELSVYAHRPPNLDTEYDVEMFPFNVAHTEYSSESRSLTVWVRFELGTAADPSAEDGSEGTENTRDEGAPDAPEPSASGPLPFHLVVELAGNFVVDESQFPMQYINEWATTNAPAILMPYIREHVFAMTARCGFRPAILPLVTVPTVKVQGGVVVEEKGPDAETAASEI